MEKNTILENQMHEEFTIQMQDGQKKMVDLFKKNGGKLSNLSLFNGNVNHFLYMDKTSVFALTNHLAFVKKIFTSDSLEIPSISKEVMHQIMPYIKDGAEMFSFGKEKPFVFELKNKLFLMVSPKIISAESIFYISKDMMEK
jgi:hypothetical protein